MRFLLFLLCLVHLIAAHAQSDLNLYSSEASEEFANYLFIKKDFELAADEYARILYMNPEKDEVLVRLSLIYRKLGQVHKSQRLFDEYRSNAIFGVSTLEKEYLTTLLFQENTATLTKSINQTQTIEPNEQLRMSIEHELLQRRWDRAQNLLASAPPGAWKDFYKEKTDNALAFRPKKPWLATTMSVFLPGSGKVYAKNVKEGITSFLFVAALGYQSFRAFDRRGSKSVAGWIYGGLGLGFYLGNLYGAQQSAKNYNNRKLKQITSEVDHIIYQRY